MEYDIVIIGGGVAGLTAALYASRGGAKTLLLEEYALGGVTASLHNIENFPGIKSLNGIEFVNTIYTQAVSFGAEIQIAKIKSVDSTNNELYSTLGKIKYKALIIATGSTYKKLNVIGEETFSGKGVSYCAVCDGALFKNKNIIVVTNGQTCNESINYLENFTNNITILDLSNSYTNSKYKVYNNCLVDKINGSDFIVSVSIKCNNFTENINCDGLFISIGREYSSDIFSNIINIEDGFIVTNNNLQTNVDNIFAVGDIRKNSTKQIICACGEGATGALNAVKYIKK